MASLRFTTTAHEMDTAVLASAIDRFVAGQRLPDTEAFRISLALEKLIATVAMHGRFPIKLREVVSDRYLGRCRATALSE